MNGGAILISTGNGIDTVLLRVGPCVAVIWYPQIFRTRGYQSNEDLIPGGVPNPSSKQWREGAEVFCGSIIMMEESGLEMDVGNARPACLESVNPIELNEHWNAEIT